MTTFGELKAVAMATDRLMRTDPEARFSTVEVALVEFEFTLDPVEDAPRLLEPSLTRGGTEAPWSWARSWGRSRIHPPGSEPALCG